MVTCKAFDDHCCYLGGFGICQFLRDDGPNANRRWVCVLREELGSWDLVHSDSRYISEIKPKLIELNIEQDCGNWPPKNEKCATCGVIGDGN